MMNQRKFERFYPNDFLVANRPVFLILARKSRFGKLHQHC